MSESFSFKTSTDPTLSKLNVFDSELYAAHPTEYFLLVVYLFLTFAMIIVIFVMVCIWIGKIHSMDLKLDAIYALLV